MQFRNNEVQQTALFERGLRFESQLRPACELEKADALVEVGLLGLCACWVNRCLKNESVEVIRIACSRRVSE
jgi:hypothetical protein